MRGRDPRGERGGLRCGSVEHGGELLGRDDGLVDLEDEPLLELGGLAAAGRRRRELSLLPARHALGPERLDGAGQRERRRALGQRQHAAHVRVPRPRQRAPRARQQHAHPAPQPRPADAGGRAQLPRPRPGLGAVGALRQAVVLAATPVGSHALREPYRERLRLHGLLAAADGGGGTTCARGRGGRPVRVWWMDRAGWRGPFIYAGMGW